MKTEVRYRHTYRYFCCSGWSKTGDSCSNREPFKYLNCLSERNLLQ